MLSIFPQYSKCALAQLSPLLNMAGWIQLYTVKSGVHVVTTPFGVFVWLFNISNPSGVNLLQVVHLWYTFGVG